MRALTLAICLAVPAFAGEHPEHPKEHPAKPQSAAEHPEHPTAAPKAEKRADIERQFSDVVLGHLSAKSKGGAYPIKDEKTGKTRQLQLLRIHKDKIVKLSADEAFACSDFRTVKGGKDKLDLDFYVSRKGDEWKVSRVLIHKVNGKPRFTYNENNEIVPAQ